MLTPEVGAWLEAVTGYGRSELERVGWFAPYMAVMAADGAGRVMMPEGADRERPASEVLEQAKGYLAGLVQAERPEAAGYFYDMVLKDTSGVPHRVLAGHVETAGGAAVQFLQIYVVEPGKPVAFGGPQLQPTQGHLFSGV